MPSGTRVGTALFLLVSACASADSAAANDDSGYHPFTSFGQKTPGYTAPKVNRPFTTFGAASQQPVLASDPDEDSDDADSDDSDDADDDDSESGLTPEEADPVDEHGHPVDVEREDAQANFHTVIEAFVSKNKVGDCWPFKDAERALCLVYLSADTQHLKKRRVGIYSGVIVLHDKAKDANVAAEATVDFRGEHWAMLDLRFLGRKYGILKHPFSWSEDSVRRREEGSVSVTLVPEIKKSSATAAVGASASR